MPEKAFDVRAALSALRRGRKALIAAALVGVLLGLAVLVVRPPMYTLGVQVRLPAGQGIDGTVSPSSVETDVLVLGSGSVLGPAHRELRRRSGAPDLTLAELADRVTVRAVTDELIGIEVRGRTLEEARALRQVVANAAVDYVEQSSTRLTNTQQEILADRRRVLSASRDAVARQIKAAKRRQARQGETRADQSALGQLTAEQAQLLLELDHIRDEEQLALAGNVVEVIEDLHASPRQGQLSHVALVLLVSSGVAVLGGAGLLVARSRRERVLRYRDQIADAVGSRVMASVRSRSGRDTAGWMALLEGYEPRNVDAWALRQVIHQAVLGEGSVGADTDPSSVEASGEAAAILVVTLAGDNRGLAVGPQLASYAASIGVPTRLVPGQAHDSAAPLWAACGRARGLREVRPRLAVANQADRGEADLTVVLAVVDRDRPTLSDSLPRTEATIIAVGAGAATGEELAQLAVVADDADRMLTGVVVADPDPLDPTTGRLLEPERPSSALPTRLTGGGPPSGGIVALATMPTMRGAQ